jgi:hypothetical protein
MNKDKELINDLAVILRDHTDADPKVDSFKKIRAIDILLMDTIAKSGLSREEVLCHLNGSNEVGAKQKTILDEVKLHNEKVDLCIDVINLIVKRLRSLSEFTKGHVLDVVEMVIICGYEAAGMSKEEIKERLNNLPEEHIHRRARLDGKSHDKGEDE